MCSRQVLGAFLLAGVALLATATDGRGQRFPRPFVGGFHPRPFVHPQPFVHPHAFPHPVPYYRPTFSYARTPSGYRFSYGVPGGYPYAYAYTRTPFNYNYRVYYGNPWNYLYGIPYAYSFLRSPHGLDYRYFLGNPHSYPYTGAYYVTPYGYQLQYLTANPYLAWGGPHVNPYLPMMSSGGAVFLPGLDRSVDTYPGAGQAGWTPAPAAESDARSATPLTITGLPTSGGKLEWPLGLRILPGADPLRERIDVLYEAAVAQAAIGSINPQLPAEMKRAVRRFERHVAHDRQEHLTLSTDMYDEGTRFLRRLEHSAPLFAALALPQTAQATAVVPPVQQGSPLSQIPLPKDKQGKPK